jgi:hypothetical protein
MNFQRAGILAACGFAIWSGGLLAAETARPLTHGREVSRELVGPDGLDWRGGRHVESGVISDAKRPDYAVQIDAGATYDGFEVGGPHVLIDGVTINGALDISTRMPVVLPRVTMFAPEVMPWLVLVRPGAGAVHVLWSDIGGSFSKRSASPHVGVALALRGDGARVYRSRIGAAADAVQIAGRDIRIVESEIAYLLSKTGDHNDAIQMFDTALDVEIVRNRIENRHAQTSAITVLGRNVVIVDNHLAGGGWTIYGGAKRNGKGGEDASGVRVEGNVFARGIFPKVGSFGPVTYWPAGSGSVWRGNRDEEDRAISP